MDSAEQTKYEPKAVSHPGETVVDYLEFFEWSQRDLARRTGLTPKTISEICNSKASISPLTALAFEKAFQRPARFWLSLQRHYDEAIARSQETSSLAQWTAWAHNFPLLEMKKLGFSLPNGRSEADMVLNFFGVSSPDSWNQVWKSSNVAYRQTRHFTTREESIAAWIRQVEIDARELDLAEFDEDRLLLSLDELRALTRTSVADIIEPVQQLCAAAGVAVVWVPELPKTGISGCARWLSD
ncbi:MAG: HigA family addiction module antitoxin, partial [Armatimonadota bacterium]